MELEAGDTGSVERVSTGRVEADPDVWWEEEGQVQLEAGERGSVDGVSIEEANLGGLRGS